MPSPPKAPPLLRATRSCPWPSRHSSKSEARAAHRFPRKSHTMFDLILVLLGVAFFVIAELYVRFCEHA